MIVPVDKKSNKLHFAIEFAVIRANPKEKRLREMEKGMGGYWWKSPRDYSHLTERLKHQRINK